MLSVQRKKGYSYAEKIAIIVIMIFPFWSLPFSPGTYSIFLPLVTSIGGVLFSIKYIEIWRVSKDELFLLCVFIVALAQFVVSLFYEYAHIGQVTVGLASWALVFFSYIFYRKIFAIVGVQSIINGFYFMALLVVLFGLFEVLAKIVFDLSFLADALTNFFSGKSSSRVILTTAEPSWAVQLIIFLFPIVLYKHKLEKSLLTSFMIIACPLIFLGAFSLTGYFIALFSCFIYTFLAFNLTTLLKSLFFLLAITLVTFAGYSLFAGFFEDDLPYFLSRIGKLEGFVSREQGYSLSSLLLIDGSMLVRFGYPILGIEMILDNPFFGIGLNQFGVLMNDYVGMLNISEDAYSKEMLLHLSNENADPRNFFIKAYLDLGLAGLVFNLAFVCFAYKRANKIRSLPERKLALMLLSVAMAIMLHFSTPYFSVYWVTFALIINLSDHFNVICKRESLR